MFYTARINQINSALNVIEQWMNDFWARDIAGTKAPDDDKKFAALRVKVDELIAERKALTQKQLAYARGLCEDENE